MFENSSSISKYYTLSTNSNDDFEQNGDPFPSSSTTTIEPNPYDTHNEEQSNNVLISSEYKKFKTALENINFSNLYNQNTKTKLQFGQFLFNILQILNNQYYTTPEILEIIKYLQPKNPDDTAANDSIEHFIENLTQFFRLIGKNENLGKSKITLGLLFNLIHRPEAQIERDDTNDDDTPLLISSLDKTKFDYPSRLKYRINVTVYDLYGESCNPVNILKRIKHHYYTINSTKMLIMKYTSESFVSFLQSSKGEICTSDVLKKRPHQTVCKKTTLDNLSKRQIRVKNIVSNCCKMSFLAESYISFKTMSSGEQQNLNDYWPVFLKFQHDNKRKV
jgi:hypothetical protein